MAYVEHVAQLSDSVASYSVDIDPEELYAETDLEEPVESDHEETEHDAG